jgi:hypothetical protein
MIYTLNDNEMRQIAEIYEMDIELLAEKLELEDAVISFMPYKNGVELKTENTESLVLRFKDRA